MCELKKVSALSFHFLQNEIDKRAIKKSKADGLQGGIRMIPEKSSNSPYVSPSAYIEGDREYPRADRRKRDRPPASFRCPQEC